MYDKEYYKKSIHVNHFIDKKLTFREILNGYVLPITVSHNGGILDSSGSYINNGTAAPNAHPDIDPCVLSGAVHNHSTAVYIGGLSGVWGHFITDSMRFLWFACSEYCREHFGNCPILYFSANGFRLDGSPKKMLEIFGVNMSKLTRVTQPVQYDRIILPEACFFSSSEGIRYYTQEYVDTIDKARDFAASHSRPVNSRKIFYSYRLASKGRSIGEDKLEKYFASKGYEIVFPEKHSLDDQLNMLINCDSFASTAGSCSHNSLFLRDNTEVILIPRANYFTGYQLAIYQVHPQNIHYVDSSFSIFVSKAQWCGPFLYFISSNLRKFFHDGDTESIVNTLDFLNYLRSSFGLRADIGFCRIAGGDNPNAYKYYSTVAADYFGKIFAKQKNSWLVRLRKWLRQRYYRKKLRR